MISDCGFRIADFVCVILRARKVFCVSLAFLLLIFVSAAYCDEPSAEGETLEEALHELQAQGLNILYSSDLVSPEMKVELQPQTGSPRKVLDQLLSTYGLKIQPG